MFTEDLSPFFDDAGFASAATVYTVHGEERELNVIYDAGHSTVLDGMAADVAPQITCRTADIADVNWSAGLRLDGVFWATAGQPMPDGTGVSTVALRRIRV